MRREITADEARALFYDQPYKLKLIADLAQGTRDENGDLLDEPAALSTYRQDSFEEQRFTGRRSISKSVMRWAGSGSCRRSSSTSGCPSSSRWNISGRTALATSPMRMANKIRRAKRELKPPYILVVGKREAASGQVGVRVRGQGDQGARPAEVFLARLQEEVQSRRP